jgi:hypothetical protein
VLFREGPANILRCSKQKRPFPIARNVCGKPKPGGRRRRGHTTRVLYGNTAPPAKQNSVRRRATDQSAAVPERCREGADKDTREWQPALPRNKASRSQAMAASTMFVAVAGSQQNCGISPIPKLV